MVTEFKAVYISFAISLFLMLEAGLVFIEGRWRDPYHPHPVISGIIGILGLLALVVYSLQLSKRFLRVPVRNRRWIHPLERAVDLAMFLSLVFWMRSISQNMSSAPVICTLTCANLKIAILFARRFCITETSWSFLLPLLPEIMSFLLMACPVFAASLPAWLIRISLAAALVSYCVICAVTRQNPRGWIAAMRNQNTPY